MEPSRPPRSHLPSGLPLYPHSRSWWKPSSARLRISRPSRPRFVSWHTRPRIREFRATIALFGRTMTQGMGNQPRFFVAGDRLKVDAPSYVVRHADHALLDTIQAGVFCYVLAGHQMGKSSLIARTTNSLQHQSIRTVVIDLKTLGRIAEDEWYVGFLVHVKRQLQLANDVHEWWHRKHSLGGKLYSLSMKSTSCSSSSVETTFLQLFAECVTRIREICSTID
jgi:AAA-like domain